MVQVVWIKRDLRTQDHAPLADVAATGPCVVLICIEPGYWKGSDVSRRQYLFLAGAIADFDEQLQAIGSQLTIRIGDAPLVLAALHREIGITHLHSHEETGNNWTFQRDKAVARFCSDNAIPWTEHRQFGVIRGLRNRDHWQRLHQAHMARPLVAKPERMETHVVASEPLPEPKTLGLGDDGLKELQRPGLNAACSMLDSFFAGRGANYHFAMSSPLTADTACSRLSTHLSVGTLSMREVLQRAYVERRSPRIPLRAIDALIARLHWHCHFIEKLEREPTIEWRAQHPGFEAQRIETALDDPALQAWASGHTGFPFLDACMRALTAMGWINFRMRALLQAFASYHLALDWRKSGAILAQKFVDYEPGIHWPQSQMQSGQTGINTPRIYNPVKQSVDQDPNGIFTRRWVPELAKLSTPLLHAPWRADAQSLVAAGVVLGQSYPMPIVDHEEAAREARLRMSEVRKAAGFVSEARSVYVRHGSRKRTFEEDDPPRARREAAQKQHKASAQFKLDF